MNRPVIRYSLSAEDANVFLFIGNMLWKKYSRPSLESKNLHQFFCNQSLTVTNSPKEQGSQRRLTWAGTNDLHTEPVWCTAYAQRSELFMSTWTAWWNSKITVWSSSQALQPRCHQGHCLEHTVFIHCLTAGRGTDVEQNREACCSEHIAGLDDAVPFAKPGAFAPLALGCAATEETLR